MGWIAAHWPPSTHPTHCIFFVNQLIDITHTHKAHLLSCGHMSNTSTNLNPLYLLVQQSHPDQCRSVQQEIMWTCSTTLFKKSMIFFVLHKENKENAHGCFCQMRCTGITVYQHICHPLHSWAPKHTQNHCIFCVNQLIDITHIRLICSHVCT